MIDVFEVSLEQELDRHNTATTTPRPKHSDDKVRPGRETEEVCRLASGRKARQVAAGMKAEAEPEAEPGCETYIFDERPNAERMRVECYALLSEVSIDMLQTQRTDFLRPYARMGGNDESSEAGDEIRGRGEVGLDELINSASRSGHRVRYKELEPASKDGGC